MAVIEGSASANAAFPPGPSADNLCKFPFPPKLAININLIIKPLPFPPKLPVPFINIGINCSLSNPFNASAGIASGGGRTSNAAPNPDDTFTSDSP
jgi:hypothetical protein